MCAQTGLNPDGGIQIEILLEPLYVRCDVQLYLPADTFYDDAGNGNIGFTFQYQYDCGVVSAVSPLVDFYSSFALRVCVCSPVSPRAGLCG